MNEQDDLESLETGEKMVKGVEFYEEVGDGNCIAIFTDCETYMTRNGPTREGLAATFFRENSPTSVTGVPVHHLRKRCKKVDEGRAREVHPRLIERLELAPEGQTFFEALTDEMEAMWGSP